MKVYITPRFDGEDKGDGGIRRVVEAQKKWLPTVGVDIADSIGDCDVVAAHAVEWPRTDRPVVSHNHGLYWAEYEWPQWALNANRAVIESMHKADAVTAVSEWAANAIARNTWIRPTVVYHGVDTDEWTPTRKAAPEKYVLWNKTRVDPICDPSPMQELAALARDYKFLSTFGEVADNVSVTGRLPFDQAKTLVRNADIYLCTSRETFGIGTLEAMACGVPVLGFAWGGQREIITHGVDGWLVKPGDFVGLERGLRYISAHREEMGYAARKKVLDKFTWAKLIGGYKEIYERVAAERASYTCKATVVITCYNLGQYLEDAVRSVANQPPLNGGGDVECIIVDDASTDSSGTIADGLAERFSGVRVIHNPNNEYLAGALNIGFAAARSPYVLPLDADNMLGDNSLPVLVQALEKGNIDIAYGGMSVLPGDGSQEWQSTWPSDFDFGGQMAHKNQITSSALIRKKVWERVGGYRRRCRTAEDADFWCRVTSYGAVARKVTDLVALRYRDRVDSMSHTNPDWPWNAWYPWHRDVKSAPPISALRGPIWSYEPPKISVVIPVGPGHTKAVLDAVDSLVAQDFRHWECIVVNDSGEHIDWLHPFVRLIDTGGKRGPAFARNRGIEAAVGYLILPLDADDYLQPNALRVMFDAQQQVGGYVYSDWIVQETGDIKETDEYNCHEILTHLPHAVTALYPKDAWKAVGGFDEKFVGWEDWDFVIALAEQGVCGTRVPQPLMQYRMSAGGRREELYAQRGTLIENIKNKWSKYYGGGMELMACRTCGGRPAQPMDPPAQQSQQPQQAQVRQFASVAGNTVSNGASANGVEAVLVEYVGRPSGPTTYRAPSGTAYRFGLDPLEKIKYVRKADAEFFLARNDFRPAAQPAELLQAAGR